MDIGRDWVLKIAGLARIKLSEEEVETFSLQFRDIINFVRQLEEVDTSGVAPFTPEFEKTPMREDVPGETFSQEEALMNAPQKEKGFFVVPRIVEV